MSKKEKKKVTVKLLPGEAVFVSDIETLEHIAATYAHLARDCSDKKEASAWMHVSSQVLEWSSKTYNSGNSDDQQEEW